MNSILYTRKEDLKRLHFIEYHLKKSYGSRKLHLLDVGCGNGLISFHLASLGHETLGIDQDKKCIQQAQNSNSLSTLQFRHLAAEDVDFPERFDAIICSEVLEHVPEPKALLGQLRKLLKPGGLLIVTVPNGYGPRELLVTKPYQWLTKNSPGTLRIVDRFKLALGYTGKTEQSVAENLSHIQFFSRRSLINMISQHNFRLLNFRNSNFIEGIFPLSMISKRSLRFQSLDCWLADHLPARLCSGFMTIWKI